MRISTSCDGNPLLQTAGRKVGMAERKTWLLRQLRRSRLSRKTIFEEEDQDQQADRDHYHKTVWS